MLERHELVVGEVLFNELEAALSSELGLTEVHIDAVRAALATPDPVPRPGARDPLRVPDPDDAWVVATAVAGRADVLVAGDRALLAAAPDAPLPVVSPQGFWTLLRGAPPEG